MILGDYHTHTVYSHAVSTAIENVQKASELGLKEIAITDHSFRHKSYGLRRMDLNDYLSDIRLAQEQFKDVRVYTGLECNLLDSKGNIDIEQSDYSYLDILICGHHKYVRTGNLKETFSFIFPVFLANITKKNSKKRIAENTDAFIRAMDKHPIDIISHPNLGIKTDLRELAKAAKHYNVYLELNGKGVRFSYKEAEEILKEDAQFVVNSDAHSSTRVGDFKKCLDFIEQAKIPHSSIANYNKLPKFKDKRI